MRRDTGVRGDTGVRVVPSPEQGCGIAASPAGGMLGSSGAAGERRTSRSEAVHRRALHQDGHGVPGGVGHPEAGPKRRVLGVFRGAPECGQGNLEPPTVRAAWGIRGAVEQGWGTSPGGHRVLCDGKEGGMLQWSWHRIPGVPQLSEAPRSGRGVLAVAVLQSRAGGKAGLHHMPLCSTLHGNPSCLGAKGTLLQCTRETASPSDAPFTQN